MVKLSNIRVAFGERVIFNNGELLLRPGDRVGLVGPNGAGKTTLFKVICGMEPPDEGTVSMDPGTVVGYFSQEVGEMSGRTALQEVVQGAGRVYEVGQLMADLEHRMSDAEGPGLTGAEMDRYGELQIEFQHRNGYELESRAEEILGGLGIGRERSRLPVESFSGGWKMRIALARILLLNPDVLLMDEPTNHLDLESILWLEQWLGSFKGDLLMTSHDREFMTRVCSRTVEVEFGGITTYPGNYDFYVQEKALRREQLIASQKRQAAMLAKEERFISRFGAQASHAAQVQSRVKTIEKIERIVIPPDPKEMKVRFAPVDRSGDVVVRMDNLSKEWDLPGGGRLPVFHGLTGVVRRLEKIALTGVNGAGKSTLLKIITGQATASAGDCVLGSGVKTGYFSQYSSDLLDPNRTVFKEVEERIPRASEGTIKNILGAFQFSNDDVDKKVGVLSGGEKSRVMLACILANPVNFLVLDEPTNHLDIASREVLLNALREFEGTLMIVSHDRWFLRHLSTRVFEIDHGSLRVYEGGYADYLSRMA
ncbi:MAG TPA: ABC-F family ATP-binding cassette domain-containing protein [Spirochaetia bacterium]|nr:ABC-F family ATP-binding cassette domain-containing protein [Spirochaetia bacterium]